MHSFKKEWNTNNNSSIQHKKATGQQSKYFYNLFLPKTKKQNGYFRCQLWRVQNMQLMKYNDYGLFATLSFGWNVPRLLIKYLKTANFLSIEKSIL